MTTNAALEFIAFIMFPLLSLNLSIFLNHQTCIIIIIIIIIVTLL